MVVHWTQIDYDLDSKTRKQIEEVFEIENSTDFKFEQFISETLDPIFRIGYANGFFFFQIYYVALLYQQSWLVIVVSSLFAFFNIVWILAYLYIRMKKSDLSFCGAILFYLQCYHIVPKKKKVTKIVDEDPMPIKKRNASSFI